MATPSLITDHHLNLAQTQWAQALVQMGQYYQQQPHELPSKAAQLLDELYDFSAGIAFKPTFAQAPNQIRTDKLSTLSYFIGASLSGSTITTDHGFALKPWAKVTFAESARMLRQECAISSGCYFFHSSAKARPRVAEYTFVYHMDPQRSGLKIIAHHSSLPYDQTRP